MQSRFKMIEVVHEVCDRNTAIFDAVAQADEINQDLRKAVLLTLYGNTAMIRTMSESYFELLDKIDAIITKMDEE